MAEGDQQRDMEIALRDNVSTVLRTASQMLDQFNRKIIETGKAGDVSMENIRKKFSAFNEEGHKTVKTVQELDKSFLGLGKTLTVGVAGGFVAVAKALDTFAVSQLHLSHFAENVGLAVGEVNKYQQQAQRAGVDPQQAAAAMQNMHNVMKEIYVNQAGSANLQRLQQSNPVLATNILNLLNQRKEMEAIEKVRESYFRAPAGGRYRKLIQDVFGQEATMFEITKDKLEGVPKLWEANTEAAKRYHERIADITVLATNVKNMVMTGFIIGDVMGKPGEPSDTITGKRGWAPGIEAKPKGKFFTGAGANDMFLPGGAYQLQGEGGPEASMSGSEFWKSIGGAIIGTANAEEALPSGASPIMFSRDSLKVEEDTHETLVEIRDILQRADVQLASLGPGTSPSNAFTQGAAPMGGLPGGPRGGPSGAPPETGAAVQMPATGPGSPITGELWAGIGAARRGHTHQGFDVGAPHGSPVYAEENGVIVKSEQQGGITGGIVTVYYPGSGTTAKYMHMSGTNVRKKGDPVKAGEVVGLSGTAGGYQHLHVEYYDKNNRRVDQSARHGLGITGVQGEGLRGRRVFTGIPGSFPKGTTREQAQESTAKPAAPAAAPGPASLMRQKEFLAEHRSKIMEELKDPVKRQRLMGLAQAEVGNDPRAQQGFVEETIDRWAARGQTVEQGIASSYFGGNPRYRSPTEQTQKQFGKILDRVGSGSAMYPGATGNASSSVLRRQQRAGEFAGMAGKEGIVYEPEDAEFRRKLDNAMRGNATAKNGSLTGKISFDKSSDEAVPSAEEPGVFKILNLGRTPQGGKAGGGVSDFNRFAFE